MKNCLVLALKVYTIKIYIKFKSISNIILQQDLYNK